jgi:oxysterol-binding protein 1
MSTTAQIESLNLEDDENHNNKDKSQPQLEASDQSNKNESSSSFPVIKHRETLPSSMTDRAGFSLWTILKQCVDKELYRFSIPIIWNEPLSMLQRMSECMKNSNMLNQAAEMTSPVDRLKLIAGFIVSSYAVHVNRISKPFNPMLGETFEFFDEEHGSRIVCEQTSHHPPVR